MAPPLDGWEEESGNKIERSGSGEERNEKFFFRVESEAWREIERQKEFFFFVRKRKKEINKII